MLSDAVNTFTSFQSGLLYRLLHRLSTSALFELALMRLGSGKSVNYAIICGSTWEVSRHGWGCRRFAALRRSPAPRRDCNKAVRRPARRAAFIAHTHYVCFSNDVR